MLHKGMTIALLILARVLQGLSAAAVCSVGFAILYDAFGTEGVGGALGWVSAALDAGGFLGPGLSGILYDAGGENAVFCSAYAFIALDIILGLLVIVASDDHDSSQRGEKAPQYAPLPESPTLTSTRPGHASDAASLRYDDDDVLPPKPRASLMRLLLQPRLLTAISGWLVVGIFETAFDSVLPMFVQDTFQWPIVGAGLIFIPFYLPSILLSPYCGHIVDRVENSARILGAAGFLLCGPSFILLGLTNGDSTGKQILLCVLLTLIGVGTALSGPSLLREVGVVVEEAEKASPGSYGPKGAAARAYGVHNAAFAIGNLLGPILAGSVKALLGWAAMGWGFGVLSLLAGAVVLLFLDGWIGAARGVFSLRRHELERLLVDNSSPLSPLVAPPMASPFFPTSRGSLHCIQSPLRPHFDLRSRREPITR